MKDGEVIFNKSLDMNNNSCCSESEKEGKFVIMVDDTQNCNFVMTGLPFQEVFIDLTDCKANSKKSTEKDSEEVKKRKK